MICDVNFYKFYRFYTVDAGSVDARTQRISHHCITTMSPVCHLCIPAIIFVLREMLTALSHQGPSALKKFGRAGAIRILRVLMVRHHCCATVTTVTPLWWHAATVPGEVTVAQDVLLLSSEGLIVVDPAAPGGVEPEEDDGVVRRDLQFV